MWRVIAMSSLAVCACDQAPPPLQDPQAKGQDAAAQTIDAATSDHGSPEAGQPDVADPVDATPIPKGGNDAACDTPLGWWATNATFDAVETPSTFASTLNLLLANENPFTIVDYVDSSLVWTMRASGTLTNGGYQQYFPLAYPSDTSAMTRHPTSFASGVAASSWLVVNDASATNVWVALANTSVSATYGDTYCQTLTGGVLDAVIPQSAGTTSIVTSSGTTTLATLLGSQTSVSPKGWSVRLDFDGAKVDVSSK